MNETEYNTIKRMEERGGSFVKQLAVLYRLADPINRKIIRDSFSDYWNRYSE